MSIGAIKRISYRSQFALEPLARYLDLSSYQNIEPQTTIGITQEVAYSDEKQRIRLFLHAMQDENSLIQDRPNS